MSELLKSIKWQKDEIQKLGAENERLKALFESEQKQRLEQFEFTKIYDAAKCKVEIDELKATNAELITACGHSRDMIDQLHFVSVEFPDRGCKVMTADLKWLGDTFRAAIEKASKQ